MPLTPVFPGRAPRGRGAEVAKVLRLLIAIGGAVAACARPAVTTAGPPARSSAAPPSSAARAPVPMSPSAAASAGAELGHAPASPSAATSSPAELETARASAETDSARPRLPSDVEPGALVSLDVPGDRPLFVIHAPAELRRAIVYLHGVCGDATAPSTWASAAARHGTLISLLGDSPCRWRPGRFSWKAPTVRLVDRIRRALETVKAARNGLLDTDQLTVIGYSQGAARAERLLRDYPDLFRYALLAGAPVEPRVANLRGAVAVAVVGGEREDTSFMHAGVVALRAACVPARFWRLDGAKHGEYGPSGERIMGEALDWLHAPRPAPPAR